MTMRGPSAKSRDRLTSQLDDVLGAVGSRKAAEIGTNLFQASGVLRSEVRLRRAFTDVSASEEARSKLAKALFGGKVDDGATDVLSTGASLRWTSPRDLPAALEELGVIAIVRSADDPARVADELFGVERLLAREPDLRNALADPARTTADKQELMSALLENHAIAATARLVELAVSGSHRTVMLALAEYQKIVAATQGGRVATVRSARPLSDAERRRLREALRTQYGQPVHVNVVVEPELIGGMRLEIGDDVIEGSLVNRLDEARRRLAG